jgi:hypothetical protein
VSIDTPQTVRERTPSDFSNTRGMITDALSRALSGSSLTLVDRVDLGFTMAIVPRDAGGVKIGALTFEARRSSTNQETYVCKSIDPLPLGVTEDLILGIRLIDWRIDQAGPASIDLVYSLWTRDHSEVETRRVRVTLVSGAAVPASVVTLPPREHWIDLGRAKDFYFQHGATAREDRFRQAVLINAQAFVFPFKSHDVFHTAVWDEADGGLKPGIALADQGRIEDARSYFTQKSEDRNLKAAAFYDLGQVMELLGDDQAAEASYASALRVAPGVSLYEQYHRAVKSRLALRRSIVVKDPS